MNIGEDKIQRERIRQITDLNYSDEHDDKYVANELQRAGHAYCWAAEVEHFITSEGAPSEVLPPPDWWPWSPESWKPSTSRVRNLEKAGALFLAEAGRLMRMTVCDETKLNNVRADAEWCVNQINAALSPFVRAINAQQEMAYATSKKNGFHEEDIALEQNNRGIEQFGFRLSLMHAELGEALEAARDGNPACTKTPGFSSIEEELADVVIRAMDTAETYGFNLGGAIEAKMKFNESRPYKHGRAVT